MTNDVPDDKKSKPTLGQAIDRVISALGAFDANDQQTILRATYAHLNITGPKRENAEPGIKREPACDERTPPQPNDGDYAGMDIKSLRIAKEPSSAREMACLVAYYLSEVAPPEERKQTVNAADIEKYFKQAGYKLPSALEQVLPDSKKSGYFETESRGEYKLTRVGHNQVVHNMGKKDKA